jgi:hypothetical protein
MSEYDIPVKKGLRLKGVQPKNGKVQKAKQSKKSLNQAGLTNKSEKAESKLQMTEAEANFEKHRRKKVRKGHWYYVVLCAHSVRGLTIS